MGMRTAVGLVLLASACGGGGGGGAGSGLTGTLQLLGHEPADTAVQVMPDSRTVHSNRMGTIEGIASGGLPPMMSG